MESGRNWQSWQSPRRYHGMIRGKYGDSPNKMASMFKCARCVKTGTRTNMIEHFTRSHLENDQAPFFCSLCGFRAASMEALERHERHKWHREALQRNNPRVAIAYFKSSNPYYVKEGRDIIPLKTAEDRGRKRKSEDDRYDSSRSEDRKPRYGMVNTSERPDRPIYDTARYEHHQKNSPSKSTRTKAAEHSRDRLTDDREKSDERTNDISRKPQISDKEEKTVPQSASESPNVANSVSCDKTESDDNSNSHAKSINSDSISDKPLRSPKHGSSNNTTGNSETGSQSCSGEPEKVPASSSTVDRRLSAELKSPQSSTDSCAPGENTDANENQSSKRMRLETDRKRHHSSDQYAEVGSTSSTARKERQSRLSPDKSDTSVATESNKVIAEETVALTETEDAEEVMEAEDDEDEFPDSQMLEQKVTELIQSLEPLKNISKALIAMDHHMRKLLPMLETLTKDANTKSTKK